MANVASIVGAAPAPTTFADLFRTMPDVYNGVYQQYLAEYVDPNNTRAHLLRLSTASFPFEQVPSVFIFQDKLARIRAVHNLHLMTTPIGQPAGRWANACFGFSTDIHQGHITALLLPRDKLFDEVPQANVPTIATMADQVLAANISGVIRPLVAGNDVEQVCIRTMIPVPHAYVDRFLFHTYTPAQAWTQVATQIIADGRQEDCMVLLNFLRVALVTPLAAHRSDPNDLPLTAIGQDIIPPEGDAQYYDHITRKLRVLLPGGTMAPKPTAVLPVDVSRTWISDMSEPIADLSVVGSTRQDLSKFLLEPPTTRAKVKQSDFILWSAYVSETTLRQYFEPVAEGSVCQDLSIDITYLLVKPAFIVGEYEDGCHARIDQCVTAFIHQFAPEFILQRNTSKDSSSYPLKRPDFSAIVRGHGCFFRGEEKKMSSVEDPKAELHSKLQEVWPFPGLPYVLGYYSEGTVLTFCTISTDAADDVTKPLLLNSASARLECWNIVRNIARIIRFMMRFDSISPFDMQDLQNGNAEGHDWIRTITFSGGHVLKVIQLRDDKTKGKLNRVLAVLAIIKAGIQGVQPIVSYNLSSSVNDPSKRRRVEPRLYIMTTFGQSIHKVEGGAHLQELVRFLLNTIRTLHNRGITHRDIRLPNIVRNSNGSYGLVDWDESVHGLEGLPNDDVTHLAHECHAPEMFIPGLTHTHAVDMWSIGYLINKNLAHADDRLVLLKDKLLKGPDQRPEVNEAITYLDAP